MFQCNAGRVFVVTLSAGPGEPGHEPASDPCNVARSDLLRRCKEARNTAEESSDQEDCLIPTEPRHPAPL